MTPIDSVDEAPFQTTTLDNGLRVVTSTMPHVRSVSASVYVGVGSRYESEELSGVSHVVEHVVFKGTERRPRPIDISGEIEGVGGVLNAGTEQELTVYWCKVATRYLDESVDLLMDMLRNSVYDPEEIERERLVVMEEQSMVNDQPGYKVESLLDQMMWPDHPLGRDIAGTAESVGSMTRDAILGHVDEHYVPSNMVVSVAGNVDHEHVAGLVERLSEGWPSGPAHDWAPFSDGQSKPRVELDIRKTEQSHLILGLPAYSMTHPDRYALDLLSVVLGEGMSSRLFVEVRENRGLAYDIGSSVSHFHDCGALAIGMGVDPKKVYLAVGTVLDEVAHLKDGIPEEELEKAKRLTTGRMALRMEDTRAVSSWMGSQLSLLDRVLAVDDVVENINAVTTDELARVAEELLHTEKLNLAVVGPTRGKLRLEGLLTPNPPKDGLGDSP